MRVVEYEKETSSLAYQVIKGAGMVAGVFALVVSALLIANNLSIKKTDPIHSPALTDLGGETQNQHERPGTARGNSRTLTRLPGGRFSLASISIALGIYLLVGGLLVMVIAFKSLEAFKTMPPYPDSTDPKDDIIETATWARKSITAVGLVLVGFALMIALPWGKQSRDPGCGIGRWNGCER